MSNEKNDKLRFGIVRYLGSKKLQPRWLTKDELWTTDQNIRGWFTSEETHEYRLAGNGSDEVIVYLNFNEIYNGKTSTST